MLANHWVVDGNLVTGQNQNAGPMVAREMMTLLAERPATDANEHTGVRPRCARWAGLRWAWPATAIRRGWERTRQPRMRTSRT